VHLEKDHFIGQQALAAERKRGGPARQLVGLELDWDEIEALFEALGMPPQIPATASRVAVPVYRDGVQIGKATSTTWSPTLKKMIALASIAREHSKPGSKLRMEFTVEAVRHTVAATVHDLPFFNPKRKTATPIT
jgi:aminomethyltransferase